MSFLAWPAANSMPGTARTRETPCCAQPVEALVDHRIGELEIAVFDRHLGQALAQLVGEHGEFADRQLVAAAVAAQHDTGARRQDQGFGHSRLFRQTREAEFAVSNLQLRNWPPNWVDRTGRVFQPVKERCAIKGL